MMNKVEEAIVYATILHQGRVHKITNIPFILHPLEVAQILSTMTKDEDMITAGILHDIVEDTDGSLQEIEKRFGERVAFLVSSESEDKKNDKNKPASWKRRKEEALKVLINSEDIGVKMVWLADKLANIRSLARMYSELGDGLWQRLDEGDPDEQKWYYQTVAENLELTLNKTGAFKEYIKHVNYIWPGTFDSDKARYRKYREVSIDGCKLLGRGAKGEVYRYDDELVIKVFNNNNTYHDVEQEIALSRKAFILGIPTAISFGIVSVGDRYGAMYELVDAETVSGCISRDQGRVEVYAKLMAELAHEIHSIEVTDEDIFPDAIGRCLEYIEGGIERVDEELSERCRKLIEALPPSNTLVHGDFHTGNVFIHNGEPLLIDMDRISRGYPIMELGDFYYFYVVLGEDDPSVVEKFMGFSYETSRRLFDYFLRYYLGTEDEDRIREVKEKASLLSYLRIIRKINKNVDLSDKDKKRIEGYREKISELTDRIDSLDI